MREANECFKRRVAILVLNWNKFNETVDTVKSLAQLKGSYDIFVIDNGSDKNIVRELENFIKAKDGEIFTEKEKCYFKCPLYC